MAKEDARGIASTELTAAQLYQGCVKDFATLAKASFGHLEIDLGKIIIDRTVVVDLFGLIEFHRSECPALLARMPTIWELRAPYGLSPIMPILAEVHASHPRHFSFHIGGKSCVFSCSDVLATFVAIAGKSNGGFKQNPGDCIPGLLQLGLRIDGLPPVID
jgi:hypothetical protein